MARKFKFKGDPRKYKWNFSPVPGQEYAGSTIVFGEHKLETILDMEADPENKRIDKGFNEEWEEVSND